jgi:outer membrane protein assembly factor BamB
MKRLLAIWTSLTGGERAVAAAVTVALLATCAMAGYALLLKRADDVSNPGVAFQAEKSGKKGSSQPDRRVDWPRFGYDTQRTKFLDAQRVRPPFRKLWKYSQNQLIEFAPIIQRNRMYFIDNDAVFVALDLETGKVRWKRQYGSLNASSPAFSGNRLLAVNLSPPQAMALRASDGKRLWRKSLPSRAESSPLVVRDRMYFGTEGGTLFAVDVRNGKTIWQTDLGGEIKAAPAFEDGTIYVGDYAGKMNAVRASDGAVRWQTSDLGSGLAGSGRFYSTPAIAFGRVFAGNVDGRVYSFDQKSGQIAWTFSAGNYVYSGIAAGQTAGTKPSVYFGSHDKNVYAVNARTGRQIWKEQPGGQVSGPATVVGSIAYFSTFNANTTVGMDLRSGRRVFKFNDGEYGPVVSDGERLYVTGGASVTAFEPVRVEGNYRTNKHQKGIIPPGELRRLRKKERRAERRAPQRDGGRGSEEPGGERAGGGPQGDD